MFGGTAQGTAGAIKLSQQDVITQIERLAELLDRGIMTDEEFEAKKRKLFST